MLLWDALGRRAAPGVRPPAAAGQREAPEAVEAARPRRPRALPRPRATCPRRWSTTWPCSAGRRVTTRDADTRRAGGRASASRTSTTRPAFFDVKKLRALQRRAHPRPAARRVRRVGRRPFLPSTWDRRRRFAPTGRTRWCRSASSCWPTCRPLVDFLFLRSPRRRGRVGQGRGKHDAAGTMLDAAIDAYADCDWEAGRSRRR